MIQRQTEDPSTQAVIRWEEGTWPGDKRSTGRSTAQIVDTVAFSYSHDILQLGDPFSVTVPNPRGYYTDLLSRGSRIELYLRSPQVNGNSPALKHTGLIVKRSASCQSGSGSVIQLECADKGWHLANSDGPLWYRLMAGSFEKFLTDPAVVHPSWGIKGLLTDGEVSRLIRLGKNTGRAGATIALNPQFLGALYQLQIEPGDKVADLITQFAKRINCLVNVSPDGYLQLFRPNYDQTPLYRIELHGLNERGNPNNVLDARMEEDASHIYTHVTCLGELVGSEVLQVNPANQNATKQRGDFPDLTIASEAGADKVLEFVHRKNFCDGDIFEPSTAHQQARWMYERSLFDSWSATYTVRGHHQGGVWWEADTMCELNDTVLGVKGAFYVQAVRCDRSEGGDRTTVTLRKPGLLQAAYGVYGRGGRAAASP